jgi:hypothetical protein
MLRFETSLGATLSPCQGADFDFPLLHLFTISPHCPILQHISSNTFPQFWYLELP